MYKTAFREYDIRGLIGTEFDVDRAYDLGRAMITFLERNKGPLKKVVIGVDGRSTSPVIKKHLIAAMTEAGIDVIDIGLVPSPVVYFAMHKLPVDAGFMITASHNPAEYNGIKIMYQHTPVCGADIKGIYQTFVEQSATEVSTKERGGVESYDLVTDYCQFLYNEFACLRSMYLPVVFDCANAVAGVILPKLSALFAWKNVSILYAEIDGTFPHHEADPVVEKNMKDLREYMRKTDAIIGIGFDGDADRMNAMTCDGQLLNGDMLLGLFGLCLQEKDRQRGIVFNVTMSGGLHQLCKEWNVPAYMVPTGHSIIKEYMHKTGAMLGGEGSCHFFFADRYFGYDDGIYAALRLLEIIIKSDKGLGKLIDFFPRYYTSPEYRISCSDDQKRTIVAAIVADLQKQNDGAELITIDGVRAQYADGWFVIRAANTQPVLSVRCEGKTKEVLLKMKSLLKQLLSVHIDQHEIDKIIT